MNEKNILKSDEIEKKEANTCMALGTGVGILGTASAVVTGAVCPLCIFIAPGLIGYGAYKRWKSAENCESKKGSDSK